MKRRVEQPDLFAQQPSQPEGFRYQPHFISVDEEQELARQIGTLPFSGFEFHGFTGKRRVVSFGWKYDFNERELRKADDMPPFLLPLRQRAAAFAGLSPGDFQHVLVTEYSPGAGIGWHRDKAVFDEVVGISLLAPCNFRFRRKRGRSGSGRPWWPSRGRRTCSPDPRGPSGNTASRRWTGCGTRSRSATSGKLSAVAGRD